MRFTRILTKKNISYADVYWGRKQINSVVKTMPKITYADIYWDKNKYNKNKDRTNVISRKISFLPRSDS